MSKSSWSACATEALEPRTLFTVPAGFTETRVATGLAQPVAMAFAPDGRLFVTEKTGAVRVIDAAGKLLANPFVRLSVNDLGERGTLGITFDPDFANNRFVYVYYTATAPTIHNRLSRFTADAANPNVVQAGSERVLIDFDPLDAIFHNAGSLHFGPDGKLYVAVGENVRGAVAQSLSNLWGKILRVNPDGSVPTDNPFYNQTTGINRAIWAYGLRNPFTFAFQPGTGRMYINDVGNELFEEIDEGRAGGNYGWPNTEGPTSDPRFDAPLYAYAHDGVCNAITGALFYQRPAGATGAALPAQFEGKYFFGDLCGGEDGGHNGGFISTFDPVTKAVTPFATEVQRPVDYDVAPDGSLYYLSNSRPGSVGHVWRIAATGSSAPNISVQPDDVRVSRGQPATFTVSAGGTGPLNYQWQRDGADIPGATGASYTLAATALADGGAKFRVVVSNAAGTFTSADATLTVVDSLPPAAVIDAPPAGTVFSGGETINFSGVATDPEDGDLPASAFTWRVDYVTAGVERPGVPEFSGVKRGSFTADTETPFTGTDVLYRIYLTVRDASGLSSTTSLDLAPRVASATLAAEPAGRGLRITIDGQPVRTPEAVQGVVGVQRVLVAPPTQTVNGVTYQFASWSDGVTEPTRAVTLPDGATTFTARYTALDDGSENPPTSADLVAAVLPRRNAPPAVVAGSAGRAVVRLANNGATPVNGAVGLTLALSPDTFLDPEDPVVTSEGRTLRLAAGRARNVSMKFTYPATVPDGSYYLLARANTVGSADRDHTNNVGAAPAPVTVARPFVDLSAALQPPRGLAATVLVRNGGNVPLNALLGLSLVASQDNIFDAGDVPLATLTRPVRLKAGASKLIKVRLTPPAGFDGSAYRLIARIDPANAIAESDESNNDAASDGAIGSAAPPAHVH